MKFYCFNEPALNSFSEENAKRIDRKSKKYKIVKKVGIDVLPLSEVFDEYLPKNQIIDFLSIDVEGLDFAVLKSNNWDKYKPEIILVEESVDVDELQHSPIYNYLKDKGYSFFAKTPRTCFYRL